MALVLLAEDEALIRLSTEGDLQEAGHETISAATVEEARAVIASDRQLDALVTDISLLDDESGGLHLGQYLHEVRPGTPVLYTSAHQLDG